MPDQLNQYGYVTGSKYEDVEAVARIGTAEMKLSGDFQLFHREVLQNFYRLAGHIYSSKDLQKLAIENRPDFEWNLFLPIILSILGNFKANIPGIDITGITKDDEQGSQLQDKLMNYYLYQANDIAYEFSIAFLYSVVGKIGWLKTTFDTQKDDEGMCNVSWYDPLRLKFDTNWQRRDTSDMRFMSDGGWYDPEEIITLFAKRKPDLRDEIYEKGVMIAGESTIKKGKMKRMLITWAERFLNASISYGGRKQGFDKTVDNIRYGFSGTWYNGDGRFKVVDFYEKRLLPSMSITDMATGEEKDITEEVKSDNDRFSKSWFDQEKLQHQRAQMIEPEVTQVWDEVIWQTSVAPAMNLVLHDGMQKFQNKHFKFIPVMCYNFHPEILETKSVMDHIIDPVSSYNLRRNTILTYVMRAAHGGFMAEEGAVAGHEDDFASNEIGGLKIVRDGALTKKAVVPIQMAPYPEALKIEAETEKEDISIISASPPNLQGRQQTKNESGVAVEARVQQAELMQDWIAENAQAALLFVGDNLISLGQRFLTMPRTIQILADEQDPTWLQLNEYYLGRIMNDVTYGKYNLRISASPNGRHAQDREFALSLDMANWLLQIDPSLVDPELVVEASPLKNKQKWITKIRIATGNIAAQIEQVSFQEELERQAIARESNFSIQKMIGELEKSQLENYQLADSIVVQNLEDNILNKAGGAARRSPRAQLTQ